MQVDTPSGERDCKVRGMGFHRAEAGADQESMRAFWSLSPRLAAGHFIA